MILGSTDALKTFLGDAEHAKTFAALLKARNASDLILQKQLISNRDALSILFIEIHDPDHHRIFITRWGTEEHFVWIPNSEWKPLSLLVRELNY